MAWSISEGRVDQKQIINFAQPSNNILAYVCMHACDICQCLIHQSIIILHYFAKYCSRQYFVLYGYVIHCPVVSFDLRRASVTLANILILNSSYSHGITHWDVTGEPAHSITLQKCRIQIGIFICSIQETKHCGYRVL